MTLPNAAALPSLRDGRLAGEPDEDTPEDLRRELAALVVDWAGQMVKDDPASPLGQSLANAVREAAKGAVSDQYQALSLKDADLIAAALDRLAAERAQARVLGLPRKTAAAVGAAAACALALAFLLGLLLGRAPTPAPAPPAAVVSAPLVDTYLPADTPAPEPAATAPPAPSERARPAPVAERQRPARAAAARPDGPVGPGPQPQPQPQPMAVSPNAGLVSSSDGAAPAAAAAR